MDGRTKQVVELRAREKKIIVAFTLVKGYIPSKTRIVERLVEDLVTRIVDVKKRGKRYAKKAKLLTDTDNVLDLKLPDDEIGAAENILGIPNREEEETLYKD